MAGEPINIFSHKKDLAGLAAVIRQVVPEAKVVGPDDAWERITIEGKKSWLRKAPVLIFKNVPDYYEGADWPKQVAGMQGYFMGFPDVPRKLEVLRVIANFRFALAIEFAPDLSLESNDERLKFLFAAARHLDGVFFTPSGLWDAKGRVLIRADGRSDADAVLPAVPEGCQNVDPWGSQDAEEEVQASPPEAQRVAKRALCLAAVAGRALLEMEKIPHQEAEGERKRLLNWVDELALDEELEPQELELLQKPFGSLDQQATVNAGWRFEGLGVLAWALGRYEIPPYDELVDTHELLPAVGFLDLSEAMALLSSAALRPEKELRTFQDQTFALHWRLRQFSLKREAIDFRKFARESWFGPLDVSSARFCGDDLAIGEVAIIDASPEEFQKAFSAASERHIAINWLVEGGALYSETDNGT